MTSEIQFHSQGVKPQLDPRTQHCIHRRQSGLVARRFVAANESEMPVTAKVTDLAAWNRLTQVRRGVEISLGEAHLVTARIPISQAEYLSGLPFVMSLKVARVVKPLLSATTDDIGVTNSSLDATVLDQGGEGVVVGVVDYGGDFAHEHFRNASDGTTRLSYLWDQGAPGIRGPNGYGKLYTSAMINKALSKDTPYSALGYTPEYGSHGTHVMDIAAGSGSFDQSNPPGVAPKAELAFVDLATLGATTISEVLEKDFGDSVRVIEAVKYIFDRAGDKPCVVNLSLGTNGGPHDGTNPVEEAFDGLLKEKPNRAIVIAASNSFGDQIHRQGQVSEGGTEVIEWEIPSSDRTYNEVEIWYSGKDEFEFDIIDSTGGQVTDLLGLDESGSFYLNDSGVRREIGYVVHKKHDPDNGDNVIHIFHDPREGVLGSTWKLRIHGKVVKSDGKFNAWIERDDKGPTKFRNDDTVCTLGSISTGHKSIVVGSYDAHRSDRPLSYFSSSGPTRDGRKKPEVSAPGHDVIAACAQTENSLTQKSGTSMASPAVTGLIARIFGRALDQGISLDIDDTRELLLSTARKDNNERKEWHPRYGYGRVSALSVSKVGEEL